MAYQRIYSASYNYTTQIIWLDAVPFAEHLEHVAQLMAGYDLIEQSAERFDANAKIITRVGRPPRFESEEQLLQEMDGSFEAMLKAGCRRITQENIAIHMENADFAPCDSDTLSAAIRKFHLPWAIWKTEKTEKLPLKNK